MSDTIDHNAEAVHRAMQLSARIDAAMKQLGLKLDKPSRDRFQLAVWSRKVPGFDAIEALRALGDPNRVTFGADAMTHRLTIDPSRYPEARAWAKAVMPDIIDPAAKMPDGELGEVFARAARTRSDWAW